MRKKLFTLCLILLTSIAFAQATYEKGYYVDKSGAKIAGYIKIIDFESINDINSLDFKKELNDKNSKLELNNVTEFGVGTELKYQKATFQIDDVNLFKELNDQKELNYKTSTLFLNVLVEGEASLYAIAGSNGTKYFYKVDKKNNNAITQLTYKKYFADGIVKENTFFRNQLFMDVKCENQVFNDFINLDYDKKQLLAVFQKYNQCKNSTSVTYKNKFEKNIKIHITGYAGVSFINPGDITHVAVGGEVELLFPSEKFSFFLKPEFEKMSAEFKNQYYTANNSDFHQNNFQIDSKSVDLVFGIRYYSNISSNHKIFANMGLGINNQFGTLTVNRTITNGTGTFASTDFDVGLKSSTFINIGIGYLFYKKYGIDINYDTDKIVYDDKVSDYKVKYNKIGINFRYVFY